jgi:hypothetical protein
MPGTPIATELDAVIWEQEVRDQLRPASRSDHQHGGRLHFNCQRYKRGTLEVCALAS